MLWQVPWGETSYLAALLLLAIHDQKGPKLRSGSTQVPQKCQAIRITITVGGTKMGSKYHGPQRQGLAATSAKKGAAAPWRAFARPVGQELENQSGIRDQVDTWGNFLLAVLNDIRESENQRFCQSAD